MVEILIVDDEESICWGLSQLIDGLGHHATTASSAEEGLRLADRSEFALVLLDVRLPGMDGLSALEAFRGRLGEIPVIVMTAFGVLDTAVRAVRGGAFEYVVKPFDLPEISRAIERALLSLDTSRVAGSTEPPGAMVGESLVMRGLFKQIALAASSDANVVLQGQTGVGKELAARAIHQYSQRAENRFVPVNLSALNPAVVESELFGHTAGAFTGASGARRGLLAEADGGTLFLDEVAEIPLSLQVKLLRAIEQGEVLPVGSDTQVATNFRVIAATHRDLQAAVQAGTFRQDLYFRLNAFEIGIPSLSERAEDIPVLASHFATRFRGDELSLSPETLAELQRRPWHGNIRELRNAIEHAAVVARTGTVLPEHLPAPQPSLEHAESTPRRPKPSLADVARVRSVALLSDPSTAGAIYETLLNEIEAPLLSTALEHFGNECAPAARALGLHRTTLKRKLAQHGIDPSDPG